MEIMMGSFGASAVICAFAGGVLLGQQTRGEKKPPQMTCGGEEQTLKRMKEGQESFHLLQNYSAERAYGLLGSEENPFRPLLSQSISYLYLPGNHVRAL